MRRTSTTAVVSHYDVQPVYDIFASTDQRDLGGVAAEVDRSFIQLLVAARATALQTDKTVTLSTHPDGALLNALTRAGFRVIHEDQAGEAEAFWFEGAAA